MPRRRTKLCGLLVGVVFLVTACALPGTAAAAPLSRAPFARTSVPVAPYSKTPPANRPYLTCPPPTATLASCASVSVPPGAAEALEEMPAALEGSGVDHGLSPTDLRSAYNQTGEGGAGQTVAIVDAYDDPKAESDLAVYRSQYGLPECTSANGCFEKVNQLGETANYPAASEAWGPEISLDVDMVSALCPHCHIVLVEATTNSIANLDTAEDEAATLGATVISNSWGSLESASETTRDSYFNHPGIPVTFSAGDAGYGNNYPSSSPYVISVGGTALHKDAGSRGWREEAWNGTGSGCSAYEPKPAWQKDTQCSHRMTADVAAVAAPETPVSIYDSYRESGWELQAGTSAASPQIAAVEALSSAAFRALGPQAFYESPGSLFDVTSGSNGVCMPPTAEEYFCAAELGYDGPTGNGTPGLSRAAAKPVVAARASEAGPYEASLKGTVDPEGSATTYRFEYGATTSYGESLPATEASAGSGSSDVAVAAQPTDLAPETTYHFRLVATNSHGTTYGEDETFATAGTGWAPRPGYASSFGSSGEGAGQFDEPYAVAVNRRNGDLAVADTANDRVEILGPSGEFIRKFGGEGSEPGQLKSPRGIAFDQAGNVYVSDFGNNRIEKYNEAGEFLATLNCGGKLKGPWGLAVDSAGDIWLADSENNFIRELDPAGEHIQLYGTEGRHPHGLALDAEGNIWIDTPGGRIEEYNQTHVRLRTFGVHGNGVEQPWEPQGLAVDAKGNVWVTNYRSAANQPTFSRVDVFTSSGRLEGSFGSSGSGAEQMQHPQGIALGAGGSVWVADTGNDRIERWAIPSRWPPTPVASFDSKPGGWLSSVAVSPRNGNLAVVNRWENQVEVFNSAGEFIRKFEPKLEGAPKQPCEFSEPRMAAFDRRGQIYVSGYRCVEHFTEAGLYLNTLGSGGSGPGQFEAAMGVAVDSAEDVWVVDAGSERIEEYGPREEFLREFATGQHPWGIAIDADGNIWSGSFSGEFQGGHVVELGEIEEHNQNGQLLQKFGTGSGMKIPQGLTTDGEGNIWVADSEADRIEVFSPSGEYLDAFGPPELKEVQDLAVDPHGNVWIADAGNHRMERWSVPSSWPPSRPPAFEASYGSLGSGPGQFHEPTAVAVSPKSGRLAVVDRANDRVEELGAAGEFVREFGTEGSEPGQLKSPGGIAFDREGDAYVSDSGNNRIEKFSESGSFLETIGTEGSGQLQQPAGVAISPAGDLWVADCGNDRIVEFSPAGEYMRQFGVAFLGSPACPDGIAVNARGDVFTDVEFLFSGQVEEHSENGELLRIFGNPNQSSSNISELDEPKGLAVDAEGNLWVADSANNRIEVFDPMGMYVGTFGARGKEAGQFSTPVDVALDPRGSGAIWVADKGNNRVQRWK